MYRGVDNWENVINFCNFMIFNVDNSNGEYSFKIW